MFHKKLKQSIKDTNKRIEEVDDRWRNKYYELKADFDNLVAALGMARRETHKVEYIKKGGPETD